MGGGLAALVMENERDKKKVLAANYAFYAAFRFADFEAMAGLWSPTDRVAAARPGGAEIRGREAVLSSWQQLMRSGTPPDVRPRDPVVIVSGTVAFVICTEDHDDVRMLATNIFVKRGFRWLLTEHRASELPVAAAARS